MKTNKFFVALALALALFFLSQFAAEIFYLVGPRPGTGVKFKAEALDPKALSLSSQLQTAAAFAWLEAGSRPGGEAAIKTAMTLLRHSLELNPLDYQARYYLAKAYLRFSAVNNDYFDLGVRELKRAARIRGSNKQIALDCAKVFFSIWPLLEKSDQEFAVRLLSAAMPRLSWAEFSPLVEMWALYVQDSSLLMELLKLRPAFFGPAADQLVSAAIPIEQRHELLALYESHTLDSLEREYNELTLSGTIALTDALSLLRQLLALKGYHRIQPGSGFPEEKAAKLQRILLLRVIDGLLSDSPVQEGLQTPAKLKELILTYIQNHPGLNDLDELQKLLEERHYFKENDFPSLYLKTLINFKKGSYNDIISEIEALRKSISFVKKEQMADYTNILLLLVDSYYSSKLLTAAEAVAAELYREQPDNPDIQYRVLRIQNILGSEGPQDSILNEKLLAIQNSRFLQVDRVRKSFNVYLFNQPWIEIVLVPELLAQLKPKQLVQVFLEGDIVFENYVDGLSPKIAIGPPFVDMERIVKIQVLIK